MADATAAYSVTKRGSNEKSSSKNFLKSKSPGEIVNSASPSSSGIYRPSRRKGQPTPSRFDLKDAEKTRLS